MGAAGGVSAGLGDGVGVNVDVGMGVLVGAGAGVSVGAGVGVDVGVGMGMGVDVFVGVGMGVSVFVGVGAGVFVGVGMGVGVFVGVGAGVFVGVGADATAGPQDGLLSSAGLLVRRATSEPSAFIAYISRRNPSSLSDTNAMRPSSAVEAEVEVGVSPGWGVAAGAESAPRPAARPPQMRWRRLPPPAPQDVFCRVFAASLASSSRDDVRIGRAAWTPAPSN